MIQVWLRSQHSPLLLWQPGSQSWQSYKDWQQLSESVGKAPVCLYFPSQYSQQIASDLSAAQIKQLGASGKQYLFEETSLTPPEQLLVRDIATPNGYFLFATAQSDIQAWQQSAQLGGFTITALLPDYLLLPVPEDGAGQQLMLYQDTETSLMRQSDILGMSVGYLPLMVERFPHLTEICVLSAAVTEPSFDSDSSDSERFYDSSGNNSESDGNSVSATNLSLSKTGFTEQIASHIIVSQLSQAPMPLTAPLRHPLNFFVKPASFSISPYLKVTMVVMLAALVFQFSADALQAYRYEQATAATKLATKAQYDAWFPNEPLSPTNKLQVQLQPKLTAATTSGSESLSLLTRIAPLIKQSSITARALAIEPNGISFTVVADNRAALDKFASTLTAQGIQANLGAVSNEGGEANGSNGKVAGQITIRLAAPPVAS